MNKQPRLNGKFANAKKLAHKKKLKEHCQKINAEKKIHEIDSVNSFCQGKRIIDLKVTGKNMICQNIICKENLNFLNIVGEKRQGIYSLWSVKCSKCSYVSLVPNGNIHHAVAKSDFCDANMEAVLGCVDAGIGSTAFNKILASLNIPPVTESLFKRYEREVGKATQKVAKESCERAATEECSLTINNINRLKEQLTKELYDELYNDIENLMDKRMINGMHV